MSLRRNPVTPKSLAARRANALKSTGPRSRRGKARVCLNALKHGQYAVLAARSARFREKLLEAGHTGQEAVYGAIRSRVAQAMRAPKDLAGRQRIDRLTLRIWCLALGTHSAETKLVRPLDSGANGPWVPSQCRLAPGAQAPLPVRRQTLVDRWTRRGLVFWCQRRRRYTAARLGRRLMERLRGIDLTSPQAWRTVFQEEAAKEREAATTQGQSDANPAGRGYGPGHAPGYESAIRCLRYRLAKPGALERDHYKLLKNGDPDWNLEPWKSLKR